MAFARGDLGGSLGQLFSGAFSQSDKPYGKAQDVLNDYLNQAKGVQNPFYSAGTAAIPQYQQWLNGMQDPSGFINKLMGQYQQSPWAKYQQDQAMRAGMNAASASGLMGSTPFLQQSQQNASNISSQDMNNWLSNVLGINTQYGSGLDSLVGRGQHSADQISNILAQYGEDIAKAKFGEESEKNENKNSMWGGLLGTAGTVLGSMYGGPVGGAAGGAIGSSIGNSFG